MDGSILRKHEATIDESVHLLFFDLSITARASLPLQGFDPPFQRVTECARIRDEVLQFRFISLNNGFIGGVDGPRVKFGNAGDVFVELPQAVLNGGDLESVGKPRVSVSRFLG